MFQGKFNNVMFKTVRVVSAALIPFFLFHADGVDSIREEVVKIDKLVSAWHKSSEVEAAGVASDSVFLRRVYLVIIGRIPDYQETLRFLNSKESNKRSQLIDELLKHPGYVHHWSNFWQNLVRLRGRRITVYTAAFHQWLKEQIAGNTPSDEIVKSLIVARGNMITNPAIEYYLIDNMDYEFRLNHASGISRAWLGIRMQCSRCHNDKFEKWTRKQFLEFSTHVFGVSMTEPPAFMLDKPPVLTKTKESRMRRTLLAFMLLELLFEEERKYQNREDARPTRVGQQALELLKRYALHMPYLRDDKNRIKFPPDYQYKDAKVGQTVASRVFFDDKLYPKGGARAPALAKWMVSTNQFAKVMSNRVWKWVFGIGLVEPLDDFRSDTQALNAELLDGVTGTLIRLKFNMKDFLKVLCSTRNFALAAAPEELNVRNYSAQATPVRRFSAEQLYDSILTLTWGAKVDNLHLKSTRFGVLTKLLGPVIVKMNALIDDRRINEKTYKIRLSELMRKELFANEKLMVAITDEESFCALLLNMSKDPDYRIELDRVPWLAKLKKYHEKKASNENVNIGEVKLSVIAKASADSSDGMDMGDGMGDEFSGDLDSLEGEASLGKLIKSGRASFVGKKMRNQRYARASERQENNNPDAAAFLRHFGSSPRVKAEDGNRETNLKQAFLFTFVYERLSRAKVPAHVKGSKKPDPVSDAYLSALSRYPSKKERALFDERLKKATGYREKYSKVLAILATSNEFRFIK